MSFVGSEMHVIQMNCGRSPDFEERAIELLDSGCPPEHGMHALRRMCEDPRLSKTCGTDLARRLAELPCYEEDATFVLHNIAAEGRFDLLEILLATHTADFKTGVDPRMKAMMQENGGPRLKALI